MHFPPRWARSSTGNFAGVEGGGNYRALRNSALSHKRYVMWKPQKLSRGL